jgi:hypothetical protein
MCLIQDHQGRSTTVPSVNFVEDPNDLLPDVLDAFNDSFDANWDDIEDRLSKLKSSQKTVSQQRRKETSKTR